MSRKSALSASAGPSFLLPERVAPGSYTVRILIGEASSNTVRITLS